MNFTPPAALVYTGSIAIGAQSFAMSGTGLAPPMPTPQFQFDSTNAGSGQQRVVTMTIPGGATVAATGLVNLAFTPSTPVVTNDTQIFFLANGARSIPFSVAAGATQVLLNGQASAVFQTGTTEGTITFSVTTAVALAGNPTTKLAIPGASVMIDTTSASKQRLGFLDITVTGADNTYSAGPMSFTFFDTSGKAIGGPINADFTSTFKTFFAGQTTGSGFKILLTFPVTGSSAPIGSVTMTHDERGGDRHHGAAHISVTLEDAACRVDHRRIRPERRCGVASGPQDVPSIRCLRRGGSDADHGAEHGARGARRNTGSRSCCWRRFAR